MRERGNGLAEIAQATKHKLKHDGIPLATVIVYDIMSPGHACGIATGWLILQRGQSFNVLMSLEGIVPSPDDFQLIADRGADADSGLGQGFELPRYQAGIAGAAVIIDITCRPIIAIIAVPQVELIAVTRPN